MGTHIDSERRFTWPPLKSVCAQFFSLHLRREQLLPLRCHWYQLVVTHPYCSQWPATCRRLSERFSHPLPVRSLPYCGTLLGRAQKRYMLRVECLEVVVKERPGDRYVSTASLPRAMSRHRLENVSPRRIPFKHSVLCPWIKEASRDFEDVPWRTGVFRFPPLQINGA